MTDERPPLRFEELTYEQDQRTHHYYRAAVPGGWLVLLGNYETTLFVPDPTHEWDGGSVDVKRGG